MNLEELSAKEALDLHKSTARYSLFSTRVSEYMAMAHSLGKEEERTAREITKDQLHNPKKWFNDGLTRAAEIARVPIIDPLEHTKVYDENVREDERNKIARAIEAERDKV